MYTRFTLVLLLLATTDTQKIDHDAIKNYGEFFNFGHKKHFDKIGREKYENSVIKSKVDILGAVFKQNIAFIKNKTLMDLVFLIDASSTVGQHNFDSELRFVKKLLSDVTVDYNHTRVAVITFSSQGKINKNIDEITNPKIENNKCLLLNKEINNIAYTGGATYTLGAFKAAKDILQNSRSNAEKVLFLITDGYSNGGDPIPVANELKQSQVTIFTIGISNGNIKELYEIATQPGELHSYLLDSFEEFESLARRALHVDLQSGDYYPLGISRPCDGLCDGGNCCDKNAYCTCGTSTGQYSCFCELGYYGSGLNNSCSPCPSGSYAEGPNLCLPCPDVHHYTKPPAIGIDSCRCKSGFKRTVNLSCDVISCPKVLPLENGYFVKKKECSTVLNSACGVRCNVGYTLTGSSIRLCQDDGTWSGEEPFCQVKTCNKLPTPLHGSIKCKHADLQSFTSTNTYMPVDTTCTFQCERGYTLVGSLSRTCLPLAQWDGLRSACKQIKCNKLSKINFGLVEPKSCALSKQPYGKECQYSCMDGFEVIGAAQKKCIDGTWDNQDEVICKDVTPPDLACPDNIMQETLPGKQYGIVSLIFPPVTDNSYLNVTTWSKPTSKGRYKFKIGTHQVAFYAQDVFNNRAKCTFNVTIVDREPPTIELCVDPLVFISTGPANITWDEPNIYDNSQHVKVDRNATFGVFPVGRSQVLYTATDSSNNTNKCLLNIIIEGPTCPPIAQPLYGTVECNKTDDETHCVVTCNEGYVLPLPVYSNVIEDNTIPFYCASQEALWTNAANLTHPDCTVNEIQVEITQNGIVIVSENKTEACKDAVELENIRKNIHKSLEENTIDTCGNGVECSITTDPVCHDNEISNHLVKRDVTTVATQPKRKRRKKLNIRFQIKGRNKNRQADNSEKLGFLVSGLVGKYNVTVNQTTIICPSGSFRRKYKCIKCPLGTFHNVTSNSCQSCDIGSYNDKMGQANCVKCPENYSTRKLHAKTNLDCREKCMPGTFAHKKHIKHPKNHPNFVIERATLKPYCNSCPLGTFQPSYGQTKCIACPTNTTTTKRGARDMSECEHFPEPCLINPCQHGACVGFGDYTYSCKCHEHYTGSNCEIFMNPCNSRPCQNDGKCSYSESYGYNGERVTMFATYVCSCPEGYSGRTCALVENQCNLKCMNNAACVLAEDDEPICLCPRGYTGKLCEERIEKCKKNLCENNGTCVELDDEYRCICKAGYLGKRCQYVSCDFAPCTGNAICLNVNSSVAMATQENYKCVCPEGYTGSNCTELIDYCTEKPCQNGGTCNLAKGNYTCTCPKGVTGTNCETVLSSDYVLTFPRSGVTDYVELKGFKEDLIAISVCFWMQTNDSFNYGTILSYANQNYSNAFTITDYTGIVLYINNEHVVTDVFLNDGDWHHVCVTWSSQHGNYQIYLDSNLLCNGTGLSRSKLINGRGNFILGQEQDALGGKFSQSESFLGKLAYLDVYNHALSPSEIGYIMHMCTPEIASQGNVYSWSEFAENIRGDVVIENSTFCHKCSAPPALKFGTVEVKQNVAHYACDKGFTLNSFLKGRRCLKSTRWENDEPICVAISCGHPAYISNGYFVGNNYTFGHLIEYKCNNGFNMTGSSKQICNETGKWFPGIPKCVSVHCPKPVVPRKATVTVQQMDDDADEISFHEVDNFAAGTQLDITCPNAKQLAEETTLTCMPDGKWDFDPPHCKGGYSLPCNLNHMPEAPDNGYKDEKSYNEVLEGTANTVEYVCRQGYKQINGNFSTCILDGYWSELNMKCQVITCKEPRNRAGYGIQLIQGQASVYPLGHMLRYGCVDNHAAVGNFIARCVYPGTWSTLSGYCQKTFRTP